MQSKTSLIDIDEKDYKILKDILQEYPNIFYVYGSRVKGTNQRYSDIDICYFDYIPSEQINNIINKLEESDMTIKVDLTWVQEFNEDFFNKIKNDLLEI